MLISSLPLFFHRTPSILQPPLPHCWCHRHRHRPLAPTTVTSDAHHRSTPLTVSTFFLPNTATSPLLASNIYWQGCWIRDGGRQHCQALELMQVVRWPLARQPHLAAPPAPAQWKGDGKALQHGLCDGSKSNINDGGSNCNGVVVSIQGVDKIDGGGWINDGEVWWTTGKKNWWRERVLWCNCSD